MVKLKINKPKIKVGKLARRPSYSDGGPVKVVDLRVQAQYQYLIELKDGSRIWSYEGSLTQKRKAAKRSR